MSLKLRWASAWFHLQLHWFLVLGQRSAALRCTQRRLLQNADAPRALATQAHLLAEDGALEQARVLLERLVLLQPQDASAWFNLGYVLEQQQRFGQAESAFFRATQLAPRLDRAWYGLALCLMAQQKLDEAVAALRRSTELQPMSPHAWYQLARVHVQLREPDQARRIIEHLHGFEPRVAAQLLRETGLGTAP